MSPDDIQQRVGQIQGFIRVLTQQCHILDERRHILAPLLQNSVIQQGLKKKLDKTQGAAAWGHLAPLLGQDLLRDQSRLFLDDDRRSGSLMNLWRKIQADAAIKNFFRDQAGHVFDQLHDEHISDLPPDIADAVKAKFKQDDQDRSYSDFDQRWAQVEVEIEALKSDPVAAKIKMFRDKHHAHLEMQKLDEEPKPFDVSSIGLTFDEVLDFGDRCQKLVAELGSLLTGVQWDPEQFASVHAEQGVAMWTALLR